MELPHFCGRFGGPPKRVNLKPVPGQGPCQYVCFREASTRFTPSATSACAQQVVVQKNGHHRRDAYCSNAQVSNP